MKKFAWIFLVLVALGTSFGAMFITENAGLLSAALKELKFEALPGNPKMVGAPPQFKVTNDTLDFLKKLEKDGKVVEIENDGSVKVK
jgi:hypothetical protein